MTAVMRSNCFSVQNAIYDHVINQSPYTFPLLSTRCLSYKRDHLFCSIIRDVNLNANIVCMFMFDGVLTATTSKRKALHTHLRLRAVEALCATGARLW